MQALEWAQGRRLPCSCPALALALALHLLRLVRGLKTWMVLEIMRTGTL